MKVFTTWSGSRSGRLALKLYEWLPLVLPQVQTWMSTESIRMGAHWPSELRSGLSGTLFGILCVLPELSRPAARAVVELPRTRHAPAPTRAGRENPTADRLNGSLGPAPPGGQRTGPKFPG